MQITWKRCGHGGDLDCSAQIFYTTPTPYPYSPMRVDYKKKALAGIGRLEGLVKTVKTMIEKDEYCPLVLENLLALKGHIAYVQGQVLESHLHTCAQAKMKTAKDYDGFITEIIRTIGLSNR